MKAILFALLVTLQLGRFKGLSDITGIKFKIESIDVMLDILKSRLSSDQTFWIGHNDTLLPLMLKAKF